MVLTKKIKLRVCKEVHCILSKTQVMMRSKRLLELPLITIEEIKIYLAVKVQYKEELQCNKPTTLVR
jgi:hypothetical protein